MSISLDGIILKGIGGFYYVETPAGIYACKARGLFRKTRITPLPGDRVRVAVTHEGDREAYIEEIYARKSLLVRPPCANVDRMFIVASAESPEAVPLLIDKMTAVCEKKGIDPVILVSKSDLADSAPLVAAYQKCGFTAFAVSAQTGEGLDRLKDLIKGHLCAFAGQSGVGKSSILNFLLPDALAQVGELSERLERGRHTTRHVELFSYAGGLIADTPGYGDLSIERFEPVYKEELESCFREFAPYVGRCRFAGCSHDKEPGCAVKAAVAEGEIPASRHESYLAMLYEVKDLKEWERSE
ncbi:MAG TPA: ribosome small subunit-dependent GTPase A [Terriglobales bacterium]|nr:ribosome small subunit-dependent GTPase A [Terriglobales bacterium]